MPTTDGFEWWSNTDEVLDEVLAFNLGILATVTRLELQFPLGETYMFDLQLFNGLVDRQPFATITVRGVKYIDILLARCVRCLTVMTRAVAMTFFMVFWLS